jgi:peptidoglycan/xylan/chitin deacetylase (PgdA/CDA1 family)
MHTIPTNEKTLYLTFDDGPVPGCTEKVLALLEKHKAKATFFVIGERAFKETSLIREIQSQGHGIGDHSWDHRYSHFFSSKEPMQEWITHSQEKLTELLGQPPVGFRSPAGVRTPALHQALKALHIPLIHWNIRFYDTRFQWKEKEAIRSLSRTPPGSIVLLHDSHTGRNTTDFLSTLGSYLTAARDRGFSLRSLPV